MAQMGFEPQTKVLKGISQGNFSDTNSSANQLSLLKIAIIIMAIKF